MDTLTQALLGGAVGYAVAGKTAGRKAALWGAAMAVLPDLDVFIPHPNDLDSMTLHRSWSHSWFIQTLFAPLIAALLHRLDTTFSFKQWVLLVWLALVTHSGLDALTVYGTQLFWPLMPPPVSGGSVFIIDPIYSLPLLAGLLAILLTPHKRFSQKLMHYSFIFSCVYLLWGFSLQQVIEYQTRQTLAEQQIEYRHLQVSATAFNTLLWRILVITDDQYYEGFHSILDKDKPQLRQYSRGAEYIAEVKDFPAYQRIAWFSNGLFKLEKVGNRIVAADLRMGMEPSYFFRFQLAAEHNNRVEALQPDRVQTDFRREEGVRWVWQRIWNPVVGFEFNPGLSVR